MVDILFYEKLDAQSHVDFIRITLSKVYHRRTEDIICVIGDNESTNKKLEECETVLSKINLLMK